MVVRSHQPKAALTELLEQKSQADDLTTELKQRLHNADEALRAAEDRAASLKIALGEAEATAAIASAAAVAAQEKSTARTAAERAIDAILAGVVATAESRRLSRDVIDNAVRASEAAWADRETAIAEREHNRAEERLKAAKSASSAAVQASEQRASSAEIELSRQRASHSEEVAAIAANAASLQEETALAARAQEDEIERVKGEVRRARADETMARDETAATRSKVLELERVMEASQRAHDSFRERTELRLENLRLACEDEELEQGTQVQLVSIHRSFHYFSPRSSPWSSRLRYTHARPCVMRLGTDQTSDALFLCSVLMGVEQGSQAQC